MDDERDYLRTCERRERRMARLARCDRARTAHEQLAGIYAERRAALAQADPDGAEPSRVAVALQWWRRLSALDARGTGPRARGALTFAAIEPLQ